MISCMNRRPITNGVVHVWIVSLSQAAERLELLRRYLSPDEQFRVQRFILPQVRDRFIAARGQLREILADYLSSGPADPVFTYGPHGKPDLSGEGTIPLRFNLSHSGDLALVAVNLHHPIGVDIELMRPGRPLRRLADRFFSSREAVALAGLAEELRTEAFYACWTRKEAYLKAQGTGLATPLNAFDVTLRPDEPATLIAHRLNPAETSRWQLVDIQVPDGYRGAVVTAWKEPEIAVLRWNDASFH